jgi:hypothetical protein
MSLFVLAALALLPPPAAGALALGAVKESVYVVDARLGIERSVSGQEPSWTRGNWILSCSFTPLRVIDCAVEEHQYREIGSTSSTFDKKEYSLTNGLLEVAFWDPRKGILAFNLTREDETTKVVVEFDVKGSDLIVRKFSAHGALRDVVGKSASADYSVPAKSYVYRFPVYMAGLE